MNFLQLADDVCATLHAYQLALTDIDISAHVVPGHLTWTDETLGLNGKPITYTRPISAHEKLSLITLERNFAQSLTAFQSALETIPGISEIWRNLIIHANPGGPGLWNIYLESAGVCPGGQSATDDLQKQGPTAQLTLLGKKLQTAWDTSKNWGKTKEFLIANTIHGVNLNPVRSAMAPTLEDAWMVDDWTWWRIPAHNNRAQIENNIIVSRYEP